MKTVDETLEKEVKTNQKDLDGSQDVHGSREGGAQVETQAHRPPKLWAQRATDHEVGASRWRGRRERDSERERGRLYIRVGRVEMERKRG